jgi:predicted ribosomally synthesized peptide with SipW-like signal peptide
MTRRSGAKKLLASAALVGGALALTFGGAFATFTDTASAGPQTITSGKIILNTGPTNDAATGATAIVPGDTVAREVDLNSTGATATDASITLGISDAAPTLLVTDATYGLQLAVSSCATAPTRVAGPPPTYTCTGGWTSVLAATPVATLLGTPATLPSLHSLAIGGQDYLLLTVSFPVNAPGNIALHAGLCSGTAGGTTSTENLEGCSDTLTYNFLATQRAGAAQ